MHVLFTLLYLIQCSGVLWVAYVAGSIVLHEDKDLRLLLQTIIIFFKENLFHES